MSGDEIPADRGGHAQQTIFAMDGARREPPVLLRLAATRGEDPDRERSVACRFEGQHA
jgi:hypothetical protein